MQSHVQTAKKGLVVLALLFNSLSFSMEPEKPRMFSPKWREQKFVNFQARIAQGMEQLQNFRETYFYSSDSESETSSDESGSETSASVTKLSKSEELLDQSIDETTLENASQRSEQEKTVIPAKPKEEDKEILQKTLQENKDLLINDAPAHVSWLGANAKKLGFGALALVTIGAITYVLYKNGTLKKLADVMKEHPYISAGVASFATIVTGYLAYKYC
jgi:hypothetical protein